jgi:exodeoxyribonuclease V alpha subunit
MNDTASKPAMDQLCGLVERVTFHNAESGFCVLRLKVKGERDLVTMIGHSPTVTPGEYASASGGWITDREHGRQFRAMFVKIAPPNTLAGIERYLGSGMVKGIGPVYAGRLVKAFGTDVFDVIDLSPARLEEIDGIGKKRAQKITSSWADQRIIREIMVFLHAHGVSTSRAVRIFKTYGQDAIAVVRENPYRLARDIRGIGFLSADTIAQKIGIALDSPLRAQAGVSYALAEASSQGHCGLPYAELVPLAVKLLQIPADVIESAIEQEIVDEVVVPDTVDEEPCVFLAPLYQAELSIAEHIRRLKVGRPVWPPFDADKALLWVETKLDISLAHEPEGRRPPGARIETTGDHRRTGGRQDDARQLHPHHSAGQAGQGPPLRSDRAGREAALRVHGIGGQDDPPAAGSRSAHGSVQTQLGVAARLRLAGRG